MRINDFDCDEFRRNHPQSYGQDGSAEGILASVVQGFELGFLEVQEDDIDLLLWNDRIPSTDGAGNQEGLLIRMSLREIIEHSSEPIKEEGVGPKIARVLRSLADQVDGM